MLAKFHTLKAKIRFTRVSFIFAVLLTPLAAQADIITTKNRDLAIVSSTESPLFDFLMQGQLFDQGALYRNSLVLSAPLKNTIGNKDALQFIVNLLSKNDPKGPLALANYIKRFPQDLIAYHLAATELFKKKRYEEADLALQNVLSSAPNYTPARTLLGITSMMRGHYTSGAEQLKKTLDAPKVDPIALKYLSWNEFRVGNFSQAASYLERNLDKYGIPVKEVSLYHLELAEMYRLAEKHNGIVQLFKLLASNENIDMQDNKLQEAMSRLLDAATFSGDISSAKNAAKRLLGTPAYQAFPSQIGLARLAVIEGNTKQAVDLLTSLKSDKPRLEAYRLLEVARVYSRAGNSTEAMSALDQYMATLSGVIPESAIKTYVDLSIYNGEGNKALNFLKQQVNAQKDNQFINSFYVENLLKAGDLIEANRQLDILLASNPNLPVAHYQKGIILYNQGDNEASAKAFNESIRLQPENEEAWLALFGALHDHRQHSHTGDMAKVEHQDLLPLFTEAIAANPNSIKLRYELGITTYSSGDLKAARKAFDDTLHISPFYLPALTMAAMVRADQNADLDSARQLIDTANKLAPDNAAVQDGMCWTMIKQSQIAKGIEYCHIALSQMQQDAAIQFHLANGYHQLKENDKAIAYLLSALKGELPNHTAKAARELLVSITPTTEKTITVNRINNFGIGEQIGSFTLRDTDDGLTVTAQIDGLPAGENGMHFHQKPTCEAGLKDGKKVAGIAAGDHYGHDHMMMMMADMAKMEGDHSQHMKNMKPKGDLDPIKVDADGKSTDTIISSQLTLNELRGRSLMIHHGPDVDGKSGPKIACAVID